MKYWRKSSRWRAARERAIDTENTRLWVKLCRLERNEPVFPKRITVREIMDYQTKPWGFIRAVSRLLTFDVFAMPKRFPKNMGIKTIRFVKNNAVQ